MSTSTKQRILDAAERLFAASGFHATSTRAIAAASGSNSAAPNFHFGSKQQLYAAVLRRRMVPLAEERLRRLSAIADGGARPTLADLLDIVLDPVVAQLESGDAGQLAFVQIMAQSMVADDPVFMALLREELGAYSARLLQAFGQALPQLDHDELVLRIVFMMGAINHAFVDRTRRTLMGASPATQDPSHTADRLRVFLAAAMQA